MPCERLVLAQGMTRRTRMGLAGGTMETVSGERSGQPATGQTIELDVGEAVHGGACIARTPSGLVFFVRHALPGERVRAVVTQTTTRLARADAVEILRAAPERVSPPCPYAAPGECGGCDWQHASL